MTTAVRAWRFDVISPGTLRRPASEAIARVKASDSAICAALSVDPPCQTTDHVHRTRVQTAFEQFAHVANLRTVGQGRFAPVAEAGRITHEGHDRRHILVFEQCRDTRTSEVAVGPGDRDAPGGGAGGGLAASPRHG